MGKTTLAQRLVLARQQAGWTQGKLADEVGMSQQAIADLEKGKAKATTRIGSLAHALRVRALWLETGDGTMRFSGVAEDAPAYLSPEAAELLRRFGAMSKVKRAALLDFLNQGE